MYKFNLLSKKTIFERFIKVEETNFELPEQQVQIKRFVVSRPEAAAIVLHHRLHQSVILIKQFRAPVFNRNENPFIYEIPAGVIEDGEDAYSTIIRECVEETGYKIDKALRLNTIYPSPGILDEKIHLFYATVGDEQKILPGGGLDIENEFLEVCEFPVEQLFDMINSGQINDAKSIVALFLAKEYLTNSKEAIF